MNKMADELDEDDCGFSLADRTNAPEAHGYAVGPVLFLRDVGPHELACRY